MPLDGARSENALVGAGGSLRTAWRQQLSPLTCTVTTQDDDLPQPGWDDFVRAEGLVALWDHDLLKLMRHSPSPQSPTLLAAVRHEGEVVGVFVGSYRAMRPDVAPGRFGPLLVDMRMPGQGHEPSWHLRSDLNPAQRRSVVRAYERGLIAHFGRTRLAGVTYRNVTDDTRAEVGRTGAVVREALGSGTLMHLPATFDDYLAKLSKKRRKSLRRLAPRIEEQCRIEFGTKRTDLDPQRVSDLLSAMVDRYDKLPLDPRPVVPAEYFAALMEREDVATISYHHQDELVAVGTFMRHPKHPWGAYWGMVHPKDGGVPHLYFDHFMRYARYAIEEGAETISSGRGFVEEKQSVGFDVTPLYFTGVLRPFLG